MKKNSPGQLIALNTYWLGLSFMWNSIHPIILPAVLLHIVPPAMKNSYLGVLTFIGLILAMVIQPISGAASDHWRSHWGRRRPLAIIGTFLDFIFLGLLAWSGSLLVVVIGYIGLQVTSNIAHGPMQGLLPDKVPDDQMGAASGIKNLMDMAGLILASLAAGNLLSPDDRYPTTIMLVVLTVLLISSIITFLTTQETPTSKEKHNHNHIHLKEVFLLDLGRNRTFFWLIASRFIYLAGVYGVQTFAQYYIRDVMQVQNPVKATSDLMAALAISLVICTVLAGWLTDCFGSKRILAAASVFTAVGCLLLIKAENISELTIYASIVGAGIGLYLTSNWALASRLAPKEQAGKYLGLTNLATAGASALSKLGGIPIDIANNAFPEKFYGYSGLFLFSAIFALVSMIILTKVREGSSEMVELKT